MAVPSSGELSLKGIANEIDDSDYTSDGVSGAISLTNLSDGSVDSLNLSNDAANRPDGNAPHAMNEWYSYDHDIIAIATPVNLNGSVTNDTIAFVQFEINAVTTRGYVYLRNEGILGTATSYENTQISVPANGSSGGITNGYLEFSGASTYSLIFGLGNDDDITILGSVDLNVAAANDYITFYMKGSNDGSTFTSATSDFTLGFQPATPTSLASNHITNTAFTASWSDPHATNPAGKYILWLGNDTSRTANDSYLIDGASAAGGAVSAYSGDFDGLGPNTNYYWWVASSGSYGNGVSAYSSMQTVTTKNVSIANPTSEDLSGVASAVTTPVYSPARSFDITNIPTSGHTSNFQMDLSFITKKGLLAFAYSLAGDPGTSGTANSGNGFVDESSGVEVDIAGSLIDSDNDGTQTIYYRLKYIPDITAHAQVDHTLSIAYNGATAQATIGVTSTKSDRRLKTNIDLVGHSKHLQIPIYTFNYKEDLNTIYKGVMAQDLLKMNFNHAVITDSDGYYSVLYDLIDVDMETLN
tara:strand:+ start:6570 stop:8150 length:1581 start_codon:yes stop_codon:yes gene_type:complete